jgi:phosphoribosylaminoimidazole-succinocarboxamide synthase
MAASASHARQNRRKWIETFRKWRELRKTILNLRIKMISRDELLQLLPSALGETNLPLSGREQGKVRDWYDLSDGRRLIVTTDRLSAFDRILARVPYKGQVLNQLSAWWFGQTQDIIPNHIVSLPDPNASMVRMAEPILVEVIVRGYITGVTSTALWYRYSLGEREIYGYRFPEGLQKNARLPEPIITPTTKGGVTGHDERLTCAEVVQKGLLDAKTWDQVQTAALAIFRRGQEIANKAGLILVDTKYEFGRAADGRVVLIDEVHTPDSSRFWKADSYQARFSAGEDPENFDKEFVRIAYAEKGYRGDGDAPSMPEELWASASERYITIYELLTSKTFEPGKYPIEERLIENLKLKGVIS